MKTTMDAYDRCCILAREIARTGWTNYFNPKVKELVELADENGMEVCFDDEFIMVGDEVFYLNV